MVLLFENVVVILFLYGIRLKHWKSFVMCVDVSALAFFILLLLNWYMFFCCFIIGTLSLT